MAKQKFIRILLDSNQSFRFTETMKNAKIVFDDLASYSDINNAIWAHLYSLLGTVNLSYTINNPVITRNILVVENALTARIATYFANVSYTIYLDALHTKIISAGTVDIELADFAGVPFTITYNTPVIRNEVSRSLSYAKIATTNLRNFSGKLDTIEVWARPTTNELDTVGYEKVYEQDVVNSEQFLSASGESFTNLNFQHKLENGFLTQSFVLEATESYNRIVTASSTAFGYFITSSDWKMNALQFSLNYSNFNYETFSKLAMASIPFSGENKYKLSFFARGNKSSSTALATTTDIFLDVYASGSVFSNKLTDIESDIKTTPFYNLKTTLSRGHNVDVVGDYIFGEFLGRLSVRDAVDSKDFGKVNITFSPRMTGSGFGNIIFVSNWGTWDLSNISLTAQDNSDYTFFIPIRRAIAQLHDDRLDFLLKYKNQVGLDSGIQTFDYDNKFVGENWVFDGDDNWNPGTIFVGGPGGGIEVGGPGLFGSGSAGFIRSVGYTGYESASLNKGAPGFILYSGSSDMAAKISASDNYDAIGLELHAGGDNGRLRFKASGSDSIFEVIAKSFYVGHSGSQFISGANNQIEISSSGFHLSPNGDVTASNFLFAGGTIKANVLILGTASANSIATPANGPPFLALITSEGYARFTSASIGGFNINDDSMYSPNMFISGSPLFGNTNTTPYMFISSSKFNVKGDGEVTASKFLMAGGRISGSVIIEGGITASSIGVPVGGGGGSPGGFKAEINTDGFAYFESASIAGWTINNDSIFSDQIIMNSSGSIKTSNYISGLTGWILSSAGNGYLEVENARIRGTLSTTVFEKETVNAVGGQLWIANSTILSSSVSASDATMSVINVSGFVPGEILLIKKVTTTGFSTEYVYIDSASRDVPSSDVDYTGKIYVQRGYDSGSTSDGIFGFSSSISHSYTEGQVLVSTGRTGSGWIRLTAYPNDTTTPYIDIVERTGSGIFDYELTARIGDLSGLSGHSAVLGNTDPGFGLASKNVYLTGGISASFGKIGGWNISSSVLYSNGVHISSSAGGSIKMGSEIPTSLSGTGIYLSGSGEAMIGNSGSGGFISFTTLGGLAISSSNVILGNISTFDDSNFIWVSKTSLLLYSNTFRLGGTNSYISMSNGSLYITSSNFLLDTAGNVKISGYISASSGKIGGFTINSSSLSSTGIFISGAASDTLGYAHPSNMFISTSKFNLKSNGDITASAFYMSGGFIASNVVVCGSLSANSIQVPASLPYLAEITSDGYARFVSASIGGFNIDDTTITSNNLVIDSNGSLRTSNYASNFTGWILSSAGNGYLEVENARIRGTLSTTVFEKETVNAVGGQLWVSNATALSASVTNTDATMSVMNSSGFTEGEILFLKKVTATGFSTEYVRLESASRTDISSDTDFTGKLYVSRSYGFNTELAQFDFTASNSQSYTEGQVIVSTGVTGSGWIRLNANPRDTSTPYIDIVERTGSGIWDVELVARLGDLSGLNGNVLVHGTGSAGFGLASKNVYLTGGIIANFGQIGGWHISSSVLYSNGVHISSSAGGVISLGPTPPTFTAGNGIYLSGSGYARIGDFAGSKIEYNPGGQVIISSSTFLFGNSGGARIQLLSGGTLIVSTSEWALGTGIGTSDGEFIQGANGQLTLWAKNLYVRTGTDGLFITSSNLGKINLGANVSTMTVTSGNGIALSGSGEALIGSSTGSRIQFVNNILTLSSSAFMLGNGTSNISSSGGNLTITSPSFSIDSSGNATFIGSITAATGKIGGFEITANALTGSDFFISGAALTDGADSRASMFISSSNFNIKGNGDITGSSVLFTGGKIGGWTLDDTTLSSTNLILDSAGSLRTSNYVSNTTGWILSAQQNGFIEVENALIRGTLRTVVFEKETINAVGGQLWVANSTTVTESVATTDTTMSVANATGFVSGEILLAKTVDDFGFSSEYILVNSSSIDVSGSSTVFNGKLYVQRGYESGSLASGNEFNFTSSISRSYNIGQVLVSTGLTGSATTSGSGWIRLNANPRDTTTPYIDVVERTGSAVFDYKLKARLGKLSGVNDTTYGQLSGYGLYSENVYLIGGITATFGKIGNWHISGSTISATTVHISSSAGGVISLGASPPTFTSGNGVYLSGSGYARIGDYAGSKIEYNPSGQVLISSSNFLFGNSGGARVQLISNGTLILSASEFLLGNYPTSFIQSTAGGFLTIWSSNFKLNATTINITSSNGGQIALGSTVPISATSGIGIFLSGSGDALIGSSSGYRIQKIGDTIIISSSEFKLGSNTAYISSSGGNLVISSSNFAVDAQGNMTASNAIFSGSIHTTDGTIGGWNVTGSGFYNSSSIVHISSSAGGVIAMGNPPPTLGIGTGIFLSGSGRVMFGNTSGEHFKWTENGLLYISASTFLIGNYPTAFIQGSTSKITIWAKDFFLNSGNSGIYITSSDGGKLRLSPNVQSEGVPGAITLTSGVGIYLSGSGDFMMGKATGSRVSYINDILVLSSSAFKLGSANSYISSSGTDLVLRTTDFSLQATNITASSVGGGLLSLRNGVSLTSGVGILLSGSGEFMMGKATGSRVSYINDILTLSSSAFKLGSSTSYISSSGNDLVLRTPDFSLQATNITASSAAGGLLSLRNGVSLTSGVGILLSGSGEFMMGSGSGQRIAFVNNVLTLSSSNFMLGNSTANISSSGGNLTITSPSFSIDSSGNATFIGSITAAAGKIGGFEITANALTGSAFFISGAAVNDGADSKASMFISSSGFIIKGNGDVTGSNVLFTGGKIGGWILSETAITSSNLILDSSGIIKTSNYISNLSGWILSSAGNGYLEVENAKIRGTLKTIVFEKETVNAVGGQLYIANSTVMTGSQVDVPKFAYVKFENYSGSGATLQVANSYESQSSVVKYFSLNVGTAAEATASIVPMPAQTIYSQTILPIATNVLYVHSGSKSSAVNNDVVYSNDNISFPESSSFTVAFWMRPDLTTLTSPGTMSLTQKNMNTHPYSPFFIAFKYNNNSGSFVFGGGVPGIGYQTNNVFTNNIRNEKWIHVTLVASASATYNKHHYYVDTVEVASQDFTSLDNPLTDNYISIGSVKGYTERYSGYISDYRIYDRALSPTEISSVYNSEYTFTESIDENTTAIKVDNVSGFIGGEILLAKKVGSTGFQTEYFIVKDTFRINSSSDLDTSGIVYLIRGVSSSFSSTSSFVGDSAWFISQSYQVGQVIVSTGRPNTGYIRLNANPTDTTTPYIDIVERTGSGIYDVELKVRLGDLSGINSSTYGQLSGHGLYSQNVYLTGGITSTFGQIGGWSISQSALTSTNIHLSSSAGGVIKLTSGAFTGFDMNNGSGILLSGSGEFLFGSSSGYRVQFINNSLILSSSTFKLGSNTAYISSSGGNLVISSSKFAVDAVGNMTASNVLLSGGTIGGFTITDTSISSSNFYISSGLAPYIGFISSSELAVKMGIVPSASQFDLTSSISTSASIYLFTGSSQQFSSIYSNELSATAPKILYYNIPISIPTASRGFRNSTVVSHSFILTALVGTSSAVESALNGVYTSSDGGDTWGAAVMIAGTHKPYCLLLSASALFAGASGSTSNASFYKATDISTGVVSLLAVGNLSSSINELILSGTNTIWAATNIGPCVSSDVGTTWTAKTNSFSSPSTPTPIGGVTSIGLIGNTLFCATTGGYVYSSSDAGANWYVIKQESGYSIIDVNGSKLFLVVTGSGFYTSSTNYNSWHTIHAHAKYTDLKVTNSGSFLNIALGDAGMVTSSNGTTIETFTSNPGNNFFGNIGVHDSTIAGVFYSGSTLFVLSGLARGADTNTNQNSPIKILKNTYNTMSYWDSGSGTDTITQYLYTGSLVNRSQITSSYFITTTGSAQLVTSSYSRTYLLEYGKSYTFGFNYFTSGSFNGYASSLYYVKIVSGGVTYFEKKLPQIDGKTLRKVLGDTEGGASTGLSNYPPHNTRNNLSYYSEFQITSEDFSNYSFDFQPEYDGSYIFELALQQTGLTTQSVAVSYPGES